MDYACNVACDIGTCDHHFSMLCGFKLWLDVASLLAAENKLNVALIIRTKLKLGTLAKLASYTLTS